MNNWLKFLAAFGLVAGLGACNTISGAGEDIKAGGQAISDTANEVEEEIKEED